MKAIVCPKYGSPEVLELQEVEKPTPKGKEVLVKVSAASATRADCMMRRGTPFYARLFLGLMRPDHPIIGTGFAGVIETVGEEVQGFKEGDAVFGETGVNFGANAEYVCISEEELVVPLPSTLTPQEAATLCDGMLTSFCFLKDIGKVQPGQRVLINGASGSLGSAAVQIAKHFGAVVTGVCSTRNLDLVKSLGADTVMDYSQEDFTKTGETYDTIFDTVGKSSFSQCQSLLSKTGIYLCPVLTLPLLLQMLWTAKFGTQKAIFSATGLRPPGELRLLLEEVKALIEAVKLRVVMDKVYPLEQTADAHRYIEQGHKVGNVVITP